MPSLPVVKPGRVILNGENPFIWLSEIVGGPKTTEASIWTISYSEEGAGNVLFIKSELTNNLWRIYSDNLALARWLQNTVQGMLNAETADPVIPFIEADFSRRGDVRDFWTQVIESSQDKIEMNWFDLGQPILVQDDEVSEPGRPYGVSAIMVPASDAQLKVNGKLACGKIWPMDLNGHTFSTGALAFSESWREDNSLNV